MSMESLLSGMLPATHHRTGRSFAGATGESAQGLREKSGQSVSARCKEGADINAYFCLTGTGLTLAASNYRQSGSYVGNNYAFRPYFRDAVDNGFGVFYGVGATTGDPGYFSGGAY